MNPDPSKVWTSDGLTPGARRQPQMGEPSLWRQCNGRFPSDDRLLEGSRPGGQKKGPHCRSLGFQVLRPARWYGLAQVIST